MAGELRGCLCSADLEDFNGVAGEPAYVAAPGFEGSGPLVAILVDLFGADDDEVDVAVGLGFPSGEGSEDDHAHGWPGERSGKSAHLVEHGVGGAGQGEERLGSDVLGHEAEQGGWRDLPPLVADEGLVRRAVHGPPRSFRVSVQGWFGLCHKPEAFGDFVY